MHITLHWFIKHINLKALHAVIQKIQCGLFMIPLTEL